MKLPFFSGRQQAGFTLVEIAIVLVIIGLLLGGVLKGQELIFNSRIKAVYNLGRELSAAVNGYLDRYHALPGDDVNATRHGFVSVAGVALIAGNANGIIGAAANGNAADCADAGNVGEEQCQAPYHLRLAGFISGAGVMPPVHAFGGQVGLGRIDGYLSTWNTPATGVCWRNLTNRAAALIDQIYDDGMWNTGMIRGSSDYVTDTTGGADTTVNPDGIVAWVCSQI